MKEYKPGDSHKVVKLLEQKGYTGFLIKKRRSMERWSQSAPWVIESETLYITAYDLENLVEKVNKLPDIKQAI